MFSGWKTNIGRTFALYQLQNSLFSPLAIFEQAFNYSYVTFFSTEEPFRNVCFLIYNFNFSFLLFGILTQK